MFSRSLISMDVRSSGGVRNGAGTVATARAVVVAAFVAAAVLFVPLLVPLCTGRIFAIDDLSVLHLPPRIFYAEALQRGESLLWTSQMFGGFYTLGEGQHGPMHPLHLLAYRTLSLWVAYNLELIASYAAAFSGMMLLLRRSGVGSGAAAVGAMVFTFSGFNMLRLSQVNVVAVAAHIPWLLLALHGLLTAARHTRTRWFVLFALVTGSEILIGFPQAVWFSVVACAVYVAVQVAAGVSPTRIGLPLVAGLCGVAIGGAQLLPTLDHVSQSLRAAVPLDFFLTFSLHPYNLLQLWSPYLFSQRAYFLPAEPYPHEFIVYTGAFATIALFWSCSRTAAPERRVLKVTGLALAVVGVTLALGGYLGVHEYLSGLPVVGKFRAPTRYLLLLHLGLSMLAAVCFEEMQPDAAKRGSASQGIWWIWVPVVLSVMTAGAVWIGIADALVGDSASVPRVAGAAAGVVLLGITALLVGDAAHGGRAAMLFLPVVIALDLGLFGYTHVWSTPPQTIEAIASQADIPASARHGATVHMADADARRNLVLLRGARLFWSYVGLFPSPRLSPEAPLVQRLGGVEWVWHSSSGWSPVSDPMPRVRALAHVVQSPQLATDIRSIDVSRTALVTESVGELDGQATAHTAVRLEAPGRIDIDVTATGRMLLVTTERYQKGWIARVDGRTLPTLPVYGDFVGVVIDPGTYTVSLQFAPKSASDGVKLSAAGLILLALVAGGFWMADRRAAAAGNR